MRSMTARLLQLGEDKRAPSFPRPALAPGIRLLGGVAPLPAGGPAAAQTYTWTQPASGTSGNWSAGAWAPAVPVSGTTTALAFDVYGGQSSYSFTNDVGPLTI